MKVTVDVPLTREMVEQRYRDLEAAGSDKNPWRAEVGQVGYIGVAGSEMPVEVTAVGWIESPEPNSYVTRVYWVRYLSPEAHGWFTKADGTPQRVQYGTSTSSVEGEISPEPYDVTMARWQRDRNIGEYPPYQTVDEWRERSYSMDNIPTTKGETNE